MDIGKIHHYSFEINISWLKDKKQHRDFPDRCMKHPVEASCSVNWMM